MQTVWALAGSTHFVRTPRGLRSARRGRMPGALSDSAVTTGVTIGADTPWRSMDATPPPAPESEA